MDQRSVALVEPKGNNTEGDPGSDASGEIGVTVPDKGPRDGSFGL